jgi:hypothetical protein
MYYKLTFKGYHEMAHGIVAMLSGYTFEKLLIFPDGSGVAYYYRYSEESMITNEFRKFLEACIAAAGPMSGPIMGSFFILLNCLSFKVARFVLFTLSLSLIGSTIIWIRSWFGGCMIVLIGIVIFGIAVKAPYWLQGLCVEFLGTQAIVSMYHDLDYLFTYSVEMNGKTMLSDTGTMQKHLLLPYWFWAIVMILCSVVLLISCLYITWKVHRREKNSQLEYTVVEKESNV